MLRTFSQLTLSSVIFTDREPKKANNRNKQNMKSLIAILSLFTVALTLPLQAGPKTEESL
jgi:hypothetical protein